jgi:hypothetical protein
MSSSGIAIKSSQREFQYPRCGTQESTGDCQHVKSRAQALARQEGGSAEDLVHLCDCSSRVLDAILEVLDLLNVGGAMTSLSGQLLVANRAAEQILAARDGLELSPFGSSIPHREVAVQASVRSWSVRPRPRCSGLRDRRTQR